MNRIAESLERQWQQWGWQLGSGNWHEVKSAIAQNQNVEVFQESGATTWQSALPLGHSLKIGFPELTENRQPPIAGRIWISHIERRFAPVSDFAKVQWHPPVLWIGLGCTQDTTKEAIAQGIRATCRAYHLAETAIMGIATIASRANHPGILGLVKTRNWQLQSFSSAELAQVAVPNPSNLIAKAIGTASVAEAAALLAAQTEDFRDLLVKKRICCQPQNSAGITLAIALKTSQPKC